ncbi:hypothetical protein [Desulfobulbus sp.]|uniref:hypothetical protein n=1 Tax=Desulfobulbus sp. TaxID=895 RepID=UPI00286F060F|nr:hypothetical protein [Desulfobulbus sp.]
MTSTPDDDISAQGAPPISRLMRAMQRRWRQSTGLPADEDLAASVPPPVENRCHPRIPIKATLVRVTDGCLCATAEIDNISPVGICLRNLPEPLYRDAESLTVFSSDNPGLPVLHIKPRWERTDWKGKIIGATIVNVSESWQLFFIHAAGRIGA